MVSVIYISQRPWQRTYAYVMAVDAAKKPDKILHTAGAYVGG